MGAPGPSSAAAEGPGIPLPPTHQHAPPTPNPREYSVTSEETMDPATLQYDFAIQILASKEFFDRSTRVLEEADSNFRPHEEMMTVAQQVAHAAQTLDWFIDGATRQEGFDLNFEEHAKDLQRVKIARRSAPPLRCRMPAGGRLPALQDAGRACAPASARPCDGRSARQRDRVVHGGAHGASSPAP